MPTCNLPPFEAQSMGSDHSSRNRKEAKGNGSLQDVHLAQPSRAIPTHKTLIQIATERQLLDRAASFNKQHSTTKTKNSADDINLRSSHDLRPLKGEATPYLDIALYAITLTLLHFTFTVLVHQQYATEPPDIAELMYTSTIASPTPILLLTLVALLHPRASNIPIQLLFAAISIIAGGWLVHASNRNGYMAVMKKAPPLGTLWIWAVVELRWDIALACLSVVVAYGWWNGYSLI